MRNIYEFVSKRVAIVVPMYKERVSAEEAISLEHLEQHLCKYKKYLITPKRLKLTFNNFEVLRFNDAHFNNVASYSKFLLSKEFYETFAHHEYILIYQLDCLVFSDQLLEWCEAGYDYIGAPLFREKSDPVRGFSRVGNGGFSLRKVKSFLRVLNLQRYDHNQMPYWRVAFKYRLKDLEDLFFLRRWLRTLNVIHGIRRGVEWYTKNYTLNEDRFWSDRAELFCPDFKIAPVDVALRFAFERFPRYCYEKNGRKLPFGCHAWAKWDREFWEPYLLK
ncbi:MAG: DUF5672 family protein [Candidatus Jordarchaeaceae archaeon]